MTSDPRRPPRWDHRTRDSPPPPSAASYTSRLPTARAAGARSDGRRRSRDRSGGDDVTVCHQRSCQARPYRRAPAKLVSPVAASVCGSGQPESAGDGLATCEVCEGGGHAVLAAVRLGCQRRSIGQTYMRSPKRWSASLPSAPTRRCVRRWSDDPGRHFVGRARAHAADGVLFECSERRDRAPFPVRRQLTVRRRECRRSGSRFR